MGEQRVDRWTVAGLALLLMPLLTMAHEIGGHAAMCLATGGKLRELGAFYVECDSSGDMARRLVALAGMGMDAVLALVAWRVWRRLRGDLPRLIGWYVWLCLAFSASGYFLFSGVSGIGDLGPDKGGGIGPLPYPLVWRAAFALGGGIAYWLLVKAGIAALGTMVGQGEDTRTARRSVAHVFYAVICVAAVAASLPNPVGLFITLASAAAASFGGKAGMISIGYSARAGAGAKPFVIGRNWPLIGLGVAATLAFALVLGPTIVFAP
ncbi:MAG: hypothetical protein KGL44_01655 [Sphingomonadales bacterium]|nr:hypothetical protein [Sphingomonadales bacterium]